MGWGDPGELVQLNGASGKTWQLRFIKRVSPVEDIPDAVSTVYLMRENVPDGQVLVAKVQFVDREDEMDDLVSEAASWRRISVSNGDQWPPHVVQLHDVFITRGEDMSVVFLMELCGRGNLQRNMPEEQVLHALDDVADAVQSVYRSKIPVHGYVTYANVLETDQGVIKLCGFGSGRAGVLRDYPDLRESDDVFAIGRLGFELLVGRPPTGQEVVVPHSVSVSMPVRHAINAAMSAPQSRPDLVGLRELLNPKKTGAVRSGPPRPPPASVRGSANPLMAATLSSRKPSTLLETAERAMQSTRGVGAAPEAYQSRQSEFGASQRKQSVLDVVATASQRGVQAGSASLGDQGPRKFSSMDPFGLASRQNKSGEKYKETEELIVKATSEDPATFDTASVKSLIEILEQERNGPDIYRALFKRPISKDPVVALKSLLCIHLMMVEGSLEFIDMTLRQTKFIEWMEQSWSEQSVQSNLEKNKFNFCFLNNEITKYCTFLRMKSLFHYKTAYAFHGDWSRSDMMTETGEDPVQGRERKIMSGLADLMEMAEDVAAALLQGQDPCRTVKILPFPLLVSEIVHGYEATQTMVDGIANVLTKRKLVPAFNRCHACAYNVVQTLQVAPDLVDSVPAEVLEMDVPEFPPDIGREPEPEPEPEPYEEPVVEDEEDEEEEEEEKPPTPAPVEEAAVVPYQENKLGLLVRFDKSHDEVPEEDSTVERAVNPNIEDAALLADVLGERPADGGDAASGTSMALVLTEEGRQQERERLREAREMSAAYTQALTVVNDAPVIKKNNPAFVQYESMTESIQNMTLYGTDDGEAVQEGPGISKTGELPPDLQVIAKDVKLGDSVVQEGPVYSVYKGKYKRKEVTVKKYDKELLRDESALEEVKATAVLMSQLDHKNVVKFVGASLAKRTNCLILEEYMSRGSLFDMIHKARARLTLPIVKRLAINLAEGMAYLHASRILHRDLKTASIMVDAEFSVKIGDFDSALLLSSADGFEASKTCSRTIQYMAPEVLAQEPFTEKSDVYSFAIVVWEMVATQFPYAGMDPQVAADQVVNAGLRPPIPPFCPQPMAMLIDSCWSQDPLSRPSFPAIQKILKRIPG